MANFCRYFGNADVVNAQSGEVYSLKNPVEAPFNVEESYTSGLSILNARKLIKGVSFYVSW